MKRWTMMAALALTLGGAATAQAANEHGMRNGAVAGATGGAVVAGPVGAVVGGVGGAVVGSHARDHHRMASRGYRARCRDGTISWSRSRWGVCRGHRGVRRWL